MKGSKNWGSFLSEGDYYEWLQRVGYWKDGIRQGKDTKAPKRRGKGTRKKTVSSKGNRE